MEELDEIVLTIDRTEWKKRGKVVTILTVALSYKGRAIPLFWTVKDWKSNELEKSRITNPKRIETMLILLSYVLCVFEGERREKEGEVQKPLKGKDRVVRLFLSGLRAFCRCIRQATRKQFKRFIMRMIRPFYDARGISLSGCG